MCKSKGVTKPAGVVKAKVWRESYGDPVSQEVVYVGGGFVVSSLFPA